MVSCENISLNCVRVQESIVQGFRRNMRPCHCLINCICFSQAFSAPLHCICLLYVWMILSTTTCFTTLHAFVLHAPRLRQAWTCWARATWNGIKDGSKSAPVYAAGGYRGNNQHIKALCNLRVHFWYQGLAGGFACTASNPTHNAASCRCIGGEKVHKLVAKVWGWRF